MIYKSINGFTYFEKLEPEYCSQLPATLALNDRCTSESVLFRLLLGTLKLRMDSDTELIDQNISYTIMREEFEEIEGENPIGNWLSNQFGLLDLNTYFIFNLKNKRLFDELLVEFSLYFLNKNNDYNVAAFLHLYRALEYMSFSFPMTYSAKTSNFYTSFDTFKGFFVDKDSGQLKFFREFVQALFLKSTLECTTKIDTLVGDDFLNSSNRLVVQKLCKGLNVYDDGNVISLEYGNLLDFMINLRNRYFHFQSDRNDNISNINFDSEAFFSSINDKFANWLSMIYLEILTQGVYKANILPVSQ